MNTHMLQDKKVFYILAGVLIILLVLFVTLINRQRNFIEKTGAPENTLNPESNSNSPQLSPDF